MHTSHRISLAAVVFLGGGAADLGCSSSSSPAPGTTATDEAGMAEPMEASGGDDATESMNEAAATNPCANAAIPNVETFTAMGMWPCLQMACKASLTACAADMCCNAGISAALVCSSNKDPAGQQMCFTTAFTTPPLSGTSLGTAVQDCLLGAVDAGTCTAAPTSDAGSDGAGDAAQE